MLLQTNSYIVPKDRRSEHARLLRKFRTTLTRLGADHFEVYEQVGANWASGEATGRFVQIMRFRDHQHQQEVQAREKVDPVAQQLISEFCALINFPYQQQQGLFAVGFYTSAMSSGGGSKPTGQHSQSAAEPGQSPVEAPAAAPAESDGASLTNFSEMVVPEETTDEPPHMRLAGEADNGEHASSPSNGEGHDEPMSESDREAMLGELADESNSEGSGHKANE